jgi:hypothetical protein
MAIISNKLEAVIRKPVYFVNNNELHATLERWKEILGKV